MAEKQNERLLEARNLKKIYLRGQRPFEAVSGVDIDIDEHDFIQIVGRSGSGKSTLLKLLTGLIEADEGEIRYGQRLCPEGVNCDELLGRAEAISYLPQGLRLISNLDVEENIRLPYYLQEKARQTLSEEAIVRRLEELLEACRLNEISMVYPSALSGGETRRVLLARALFLKPRLILADEPLSDLDIRSRREVMDLILHSHSMGSSFLLVTHELDEIDFGRIYTMSEGRLEEGFHL